MTTTKEYWEIEGQPLQEFGFNITSWGGDLQAPPPLRGSDLMIPYRPGEVLQKRRPAGRTLTFNMWLVGGFSTETGLYQPDPYSNSDYFRYMWDAMRNLMWNKGNPVTITKRWKDLTTGTILSASATGIYANGLAPTMTGNSRATFSVEYYLPDPFFYGDEETISFESGTAPQVNSIIKGDYETTAITLEMMGARNNIRLTNNSEAIYVNVNQNLASGQKIVLDIDRWTATKNPGTAEANVIGAVNSFGHEYWFALVPGLQRLTLSSSSGTGTAVLKYKPRYI